jgi:hypothetical protein
MPLTVPSDTITHCLTSELDQAFAPLPEPDRHAVRWGGACCSRSSTLDSNPHEDLRWASAAQGQQASVLPANVPDRHESGDRCLLTTSVVRATAELPRVRFIPVRHGAMPLARHDRDVPAGASRRTTLLGGRPQRSSGHARAGHPAARRRYLTLERRCLAADFAAALRSMAINVLVQTHFCAASLPLCVEVPEGDHKPEGRVKRRHSRESDLADEAPHLAIAQPSSWHRTTDLYG